MNYDASSFTSDTPPDDGLDANVRDAAVEAGPSPSQDEQRNDVRRRQTKRLKLLDDLVRSLDIAVYAELSVLYYMDPSLLRFFLRAIPQFFYFTPQPAGFPPSPFSAPYIGVIFLTNMICLLVHIFSAAPEAGEAMRGYLHGGLFVDFVGEKGPISKTRLVLLDLLTVTIQLILLAVVMNRRDLTKVMSRNLTQGYGSTATPMQDLDSEEQGLHAVEETPLGEIEMQPLRSRSTNIGDENDREADGSLNSSNAFQQRATDEHPLNTYDGGQRVIANLHILESIRISWRQRYDQFSMAPNSTSSFTARVPGGMRVRYSVGRPARGRSATLNDA